MIGDVVLDTEATKPAISEVELDFAAQCAFRADGKYTMRERIKRKLSGDVPRDVDLGGPSVAG